ncbi:MAG TPA: hypothetical protein GX708_09745 [Gallicola sp.]|nr:hypothetical protein [Gallicola sp.]
MYITVKSLKKTLGKYIELTDLYIGLPSLIIFIILFSIPTTRLISLFFITIVLFLMIPINLSKKNRMYKVMYLVFKFIFKNKEYIYFREGKVNDIGEKNKRRKGIKFN